jgi:hypothetical protein
MALLIEDEKMYSNFYSQYNSSFTEAKMPIMSTRTVSQGEMLTLSGAHVYGFSLVALIII